MKDKKILEPYAEEMRILRNARMNNKLVVFVGAGTSFDSGMPSWSEAIKIIADRLGIMEEQLDYIKIPQYYYNSRGKKEYAELMREIFKCDDDLDIQDVHKKIIQLNAHTIITTNYDSLIEKAAKINCGKRKPNEGLGYYDEQNSYISASVIDKRIIGSEQIAIENLMIYDFFEALVSERQKLIVIMLVDGYKKIEIIKFLDITYYRLQKEISTIRKLLSALCYE